MTANASTVPDDVGDALGVLFVSLQHGDRTALRPAFDLLSPVVTRFTRKLLVGADAEDAAQSALMQVFERVDQFDAKRGSALSWALSIATWSCRTVSRRRQRESSRQVVLDDNVPATSRAGGVDQLLNRERLAAALEAIDQLRPDDRAVLLRVLDDEQLDATGRKRKQRALSRLRAAFSLRSP